MESLPLNSQVDVAGIVSHVTEVTLVTTKYSSTLRKCSATLVDDSFCSIELTIWGAAADTVGADLAKVLDRLALCPHTHVHELHMH